MKITDHNDKTIPIDTIKVIRDITCDQLIVSRGKIHVTEAKDDSDTIHAPI